MGNTCTSSKKNGSSTIQSSFKSFNYNSKSFKKVPDDAEDVIICTSVSKIEKKAFEYMSSLRKINLSESVMSIDDEAFHGCSNLEKIDLPTSTEIIENAAFKDCKNLVEINILKDLSSLSMAGDEVFSNCKSLKSITLPSSLVEIGKYAFYGCDNLKSVIIHPSSKIQTIKQSTFCDCTSLTQINIPETVVTIQQNAFRNCKSLKSLQLPKGIKTIETEAFFGCSSLSLMEIPPSVAKFEMNAFQQCSALQFVKINPLMTVTYEHSMFAFQGCSSLMAVSLPLSMESISMNSFQDCSSLLSVYIPPSVQSIGDGSFMGCVSLTCINLPSSVTHIGRNAFRNCLTLQVAFQRSTLFNPETQATFDDFTSFLKNRFINLPIHEECYNYRNESSLERIEEAISEHAGVSGTLTENVLTNDGFEMSPIHVLACNLNANIGTISTVLNLFRFYEKPLILKKMKTAIGSGESFSPLQLYMKCRGITHMSLIEVVKQGMPWAFIKELIEMQSSISETEIADVADAGDNEQHSTEGLYPFMIAAMQQNCDLETTYNLARSNVHLLTR